MDQNTEHHVNGSYECGVKNILRTISTTFTLIPNDDNVTKVYYINPTTNAKSCAVSIVGSTYTVSPIFDVGQSTLNPDCAFSFNDPILTLKFRSYAVDDAYTDTDRYFTYTCDTTTVVLTSNSITGQLVPPSNINVPIVTLSTTYVAALEYWDGANTVTSGNLGDNVRLRFTYYHSSNKDYLDYTCGIITNCIAASNAAYSGNVSFIGTNGCHISQDIIAINSGFVSNTSISNSTHYYAMTPYFDLRSFESTSIPPLTVYVQCDVTYYYGPCSFTNHCNARRKRDVSESLTRTSRVRTIIIINGRESDKKTAILQDENINQRCLDSFTFIGTISVLSTLIAIFFGIGILVYLNLRRFPTKDGNELTNPMQFKSFPILQAVNKAS
ncbi:hypothetical protein CHS0354_016000 [Potamilus streckersoni]|uniref:ZP domain-containing protein n=1 Tax=Potamilus streckersoni TaxID=2493646 RepID=A0AAE0SYF9_9BIVA|nr:hypothetical protein CHS0354_016000 [Potamilus streckersoni]